jgi:hypothetical protein
MGLLLDTQATELELLMSIGKDVTFTVCCAMLVMVPDATVSMSVYWAAILKTTLVTELFGDPNAEPAGCEDQEKVALESVPEFPLSVKEAPTQ